MKLVVETDIGNDADDYFSLCYLISAGVDLKAILVYPGYRDQIAITKLLLREVELDIPVGSASVDIDKPSLSGPHVRIMDHYGAEKSEKPDGPGHEIMNTVMSEHPDCELFVCGPMKNFRKFYHRNATFPKRATMQGGFVPYSVTDAMGIDVVRLDKFEGRDLMPTTNLNGDMQGSIMFLDAPIERRFVGKNVCHTLNYNKDIHDYVRLFEANSRASEMLREGMDVYLAKKQGKLFHDPVAAICHLHPDVATWITGKPYREGGKWGTHVFPDGDLLAVAIDENRMWDILAQGL